MNGYFRESINYFLLFLGFELVDIEAICGILCFLTSFVMSVIGLIIKIKKATADGKITKEEIEDLEQTVEEIKENAENYGKSKSKRN